MREPEPFEVVRFYDPEIVRCVSAGEAGDYSSHRDLSKLDLPDDCKPVRFRCRLLSRKSRRQVTQKSSPEEKYEMAFRLGVLSVENLPGPNGQTRTWSANRKGEWEPLTDEALDSLELGDPDLWEIGSVIAAKSFLALGTPLACAQLDSSLRAWVATSTHLRLAAQSKAPETPPDSPSD